MSREQGRKALPFIEGVVCDDGEGNAYVAWHGGQAPDFGTKVVTARTVEGIDWLRLFRDDLATWDSLPKDEVLRAADYYIRCDAYAEHVPGEPNRFSLKLGSVADHESEDGSDWDHEQDMKDAEE